MKRKEEKVKNNPGIYKLFKFNEKKSKWIPEGKFRAIKRVLKDGESHKEQAVFGNIEDAKAFRKGILKKKDTKDIHKQDIPKEQGLTFQALTKEWRKFHFLKLEYGSQHCTIGT